MIYLTEADVIDLHDRLIQQSGGASGLRDASGLQSCTVQPQMMFAGVELYPTLADKAASLGYLLVCNHPFVDGNKRVGHAAMETFLVLNGYELSAGVDEQEAIILQVAAGQMKQDAFTQWVKSRIVARP